MKRCAFFTLGCKVNQYDTQAMRELFERSGYQTVPFEEEADVYLINTCTVTGTGDAKSLRLIRRVARDHPDAGIIVSGCLAQRDARVVSLQGVRLVLGVKHRARVVELYERALREQKLCVAVDDQEDWTFENLTVDRHEGKTRATMKIQEGCDRRCAYCVIPSVRGPARSMPLAEVRREAARLNEAGYLEIVLTGIHLSSYGRENGETLLDALRAVHELDGIRRIRLGSLEPTIVTDEWVEEIQKFPKLCAQFHLSMQSGSASVLKRMRRSYTPGDYALSAGRLKAAFSDCALTTDVLTGFPGETNEEANETISFVKRIGFSRIHVFPYSRRAGTDADKMPDQVSEAIKRARSHELIALGNNLEEAFVKGLNGSVQAVLFEEYVEGGQAEGYTSGYVRVRADAHPGELARVRIISTQKKIAYGARID